MKGLSYSRTQEILACEAEHISILPELPISILRNITIEPMEPYLRYLAYQMGSKAAVKYGAFDQIYQEAVAGQGELLNSETQVVLVFLRLDLLSNDLAHKYASLSREAVRAESERIRNFAEAVINGIRRQTRAMILWHYFELPIYPALGVFDIQSGDGQRAAISELNRAIQQSLAATPNAYGIDLNLCLARMGADKYYDQRYWHLAKLPYTRDALSIIAEEDFKAIRAAKGKNKKCLVLDCDNTLWGGILGEDGLAGIKLGKTFPGSAYYEFQQEILNHYYRGVIVALCSKNNEDDVWEVIRKHPDMALKEEHIATAQINWRDKAANLRQIALDLNIGLDSLVFLDDSEFEINLINRELPEVATIHLPANSPAAYSTLLAGSGYFDTLTLSDEDRTRGQMYKADTGRKKLQAVSTDLDSYYRSLEMVAEIRFADTFTIPRIAQLTQRTNQFNLTTRRYTEADIQAFVESPQADVLAIRLKDQFGDLGLVGLCILTYQDQAAEVDTFLFSCRALGRKAEEILLSECLALAKARKCSQALGAYVPTRKNGQVQDFYPRQGFTEIQTGGENKIFTISVLDYSPPTFDFMKDIISDVREVAQA